MLLIAVGNVLFAQSLEQRVAAIAARGGATWIEYRVPMNGPRRMCCFDNGIAQACRLERGDGVELSSPAGGPAAPVTVEPPSEMRVFAKLEAGRVVRVRTFSLDCSVDTAAASVARLDAVGTDESVRWLTGVVRDASTADAIRQSAIAAIAVHSGTAAVSTLIDVARNGRRPEARSRALFWLAQRAGAEAVKAIGGAVDADPDLTVRRQAVFALSRLPRNDGVPLLIELARTHREPEIRRQAMFWLGQSGDPRAVDFFESILSVR